MAKVYKAHQILRIGLKDENAELNKDTKLLRERINQDVQKFLAKGGKVIHVPGFESTESLDRVSLTAMEQVA